MSNIFNGTAEDIQHKLIAGENITIDDVTNTISASASSEYNFYVVDTFDELSDSATEDDVAFVLESTQTEDDPPVPHPSGVYVYDGEEWVYLGIATAGEELNELDARIGAVEENEHTHANKTTVLDKLIAIVQTQSDLSNLEPTNGDLAIVSKTTYNNAGAVTSLGGLYLFTVETSANTWRYISDWHEHANKSTLDGFSGTSTLKFKGEEVPTIPVDDVQLLTQTTYDRLYFTADLEAVPVTITHNYILHVFSGDDYVKLSETIDSTTGLPVRHLHVYVNGSLYAYTSRAYGSTAAGWYDENDDPCDPPVVTNFTPTSLRVNDEISGEVVSYSDFTDLPALAQEALRTMSMVIHTTKNRVDHPYTPEDNVLRYVGTIEQNRKYAYRTGHDFTLTLPTITWQPNDAQFVLYLDCTSAIDVTFPTGTLFVGGVPDTKTGYYKIIGTWLPNVCKWSIGCIEAEAVE